jgi:Flp pilus assembly protein TadD
MALSFAVACPAYSEGTGSALSKANSLAAHQQYKEALGLYAEAAKQEPKNFTVFEMWGRTLALTGDMATAIDQFREAEKLAPSNLEVINELGVALSADGQHDQAVDQFKRVIHLNPKFIGAYNNLGVTLMQKGDYEGAVGAFKESLKLQPKNALIKKKLEEASAHSKNAGSPKQP